MPVTDKFLLLEASALPGLACLNLWDVCFGILFELYLALYQRHHKQHNGENYQCPSKANKFVRLASDFAARFFCSSAIQPGQSWSGWGRWAYDWHCEHTGQCGYNLLLHQVLV
jgi:hypothetical protein